MAASTRPRSVIFISTLASTISSPPSDPPIPPPPPPPTPHDPFMSPLMESPIDTHTRDPQRSFSSLNADRRPSPPSPLPMDTAAPSFDTNRTNLNSQLHSLATLLQPSLTLENQGSVARDHLASERTFLAYVRTSLAIASAGVALVQLFTISTDSGSRQVQGYARPLGVVIIIVGIAVLVVGFTRYFNVQAALVKGMYPAARVTVAATAFALGVIVTVVFAILIARR